jgi:hypothetical protein
MHLFLVRFVTVRLTYIFIDYPDCEYIIILNTEQLYETNRRETAFTHPRKKNYPLEKTNYRPVSVLPIFSILYEKENTLKYDFFN